MTGLPHKLSVIVRSGLAAVLVVGVAAACTTSSKGPKTGGATTLRVGLSTEPTQLDPDQLKSGNDSFFTRNVFDLLYNRDPDGKLVPGIATAYKVSPDGKTYTFTLRKGVKFSDGTPVTAEDVAFSFKRYADPKLNTVFSFNLAALTDAKVVNSDTVELDFKQPVGDFVAEGGYASIVPEKYIKQHGDAYFAKHPIGTGPYKFVSFNPNQGFTLERNNNYWGTKTAYDRVDFKYIADPSTRVAALQSGQVDVIDQVPPQDVATLRGNSSITVKTQIAGDMVYTFINTLDRGKPWDDVRVRQAMAYAIDQKTILKTVLGGFGVLNVGVSPIEPGYDKVDFQQYPYDPAKAKELLAAAGYPKGFSLDFWGPANGRTPNSEQYIEAIAGYWKAVGIKANVHIVEYPEYVKKQGPTANVNGAIFGIWGGGYFDPQFRTEGNLKCHSAYSVTCDPKLDQMIDKLEATIGETARENVYIPLYKYVLDQALMIYGYCDEETFAMSKKVSWQPYKGQSYTIMTNAAPAGA